jgi:hypothetical protein
VPVPSCPPSSPVRLLPAAVRRARLFREFHGRRASLVRPRTFTEKLNRRIALDRRALLAPTCDKLAMKEHARRAAPGLVRIPETYWCGTDVRELAEVALPTAWVLKPNHSCRRVLTGRGAPDVEQLAARTAGWVEEQYWRHTDEWAYRRARAGLLVEEFIGVPGRVPVDLKVLTFDGVPYLVEVHTGRGADQRVRLYDPDWRPLPWTLGYPAGADAAPPENLEDLLKVAAAAAAGFDMLRVDLYEHDGELWFGELTPYPGSGLGRLEPELDALLGKAWTLPPLLPRHDARHRR